MVSAGEAHGFYTGFAFQTNMVMIWEKITRNRCDIIIIPKKIFSDFYDVHVFREFNPKEIKTCLVMNSNNWTGIPNKATIIQLLKTALDKVIIEKGYDVPFQIPHLIFTNIKCRTFQYTESGIVPYGNEYDGDFHMSIEKIKCGWKKTHKILRGMSIIEKSISTHEIKNVFENIPKECNNIFVFIINHIHIEERR